MALSGNNYCPVSIAFDRNAVVQPIFCGRWSCPTCQKRLANKWALRAKLGLSTSETDPNPEMWFLTLTLGSFYRSATQGFEALPGLWDTTRKNFQRTYGDWMYMAFVEGQPQRGNMPHFHILTDHEPPAKRGRKGYVTKHNLHDWAVAFGWGFECDLVLVNGDDAAGYVAKYASKQSSSTPKRFRRVRCSRNWPQLPKDPNYAYLVPSKNEDIANFIDRVSSIVDVPQEILYRRWADGQIEFLG